MKDFFVTALLLIATSNFSEAATNNFTNGSKCDGHRCHTYLNAMSMAQIDLNSVQIMNSDDESMLPFTVTNGFNHADKVKDDLLAGTGDDILLSQVFSWNTTNETKSIQHVYVFVTEKILSEDLSQFKLNVVFDGIDHVNYSYVIMGATQEELMLVNGPTDNLLHSRAVPATKFFPEN